MLLARGKRYSRARNSEIGRVCDKRVEDKSKRLHARARVMQEVEMIIDKPRELVIESAISDKPGRPLITKYLAGPWGAG